MKNIHPGFFLLLIVYLKYSLPGKNSILQAFFWDTPIIQSEL